jgi:two-component system sensor histidine kinase BarA
VNLTIVNSGKEAIESCQENAFDLILLDIQMPEMDGIETLKRLQTLPCFRDVQPPVHAFTAHASDNDREHYLSHGFAGVLTKPLMPAQLNELLAKYSSDEHEDQA